MKIESLNTPEIEFFKTKLNSYPRMHGYYIIDFISLRDTFPGTSSEEILDRGFEYFDDKDWPPLSERPADQSWQDYSVSEMAAKNHFIESLVGGTNIGHTRETIPPSEAENFWNQFISLFSGPKLFLAGMGLGDSKYVFQNGVGILSADRLGVCLVVESD